MSRLIGALLAGGKSSRMGEPKAGVRRSDGKSFAEVSLAALRSVCDEVVVLGHGAGCPEELRRLEDALPDIGPLGGLLALARQEQDAEVVVVPCDLPRLTAAPLRHLVEDARARGASTAVLAPPDERFQPLPLYLDAAGLREVEGAVDRGERRLTRFVASLSPLLVLPSASDLRALRGANTPAELMALEEERRARRFEVRRLRDDTFSDEEDAVAEEEPLELRVMGTNVAVTMRTPGHDEELAAGFLVTEGVVNQADDIAMLRHCSVVPDPEAEENVLDVTLREGVALDLEALRRNLFASSSCGVCGKATLQSARARATPLSDERTVSAELLYALPEKLRDAQRVFDSTGGLHAAALFDASGSLLVLREDVGRHNAVDKVIGWALVNRRLQESLVLLVSGRVSFEVVQKASAARLPIIAAISAPSSLAVRLGETMNVTVIGFLRGRSLNVYSAKQRVVL